MTTGGSRKGGMMIGYVMSVAIAVVVGVLLFSVMKKMFIRAFLSIDTDPAFHAKMISIVLSRMLFMPEGTKFYYHLPEADDCEISLFPDFVYVRIGESEHFEPVLSMPCNSTIEAHIGCGGDMIVEKRNGNVVAYHSGAVPPESRRRC